MAENNRKAANKIVANLKVCEKKTPLGGFESIDTFTKNGFQEIIQATKSVNGFPTGSSRDLYCAYPSFGKVIDETSDCILGLISKVLKLQNIRGNIQRRQPDEQFEMLLECNDVMLERIGSNLDELAGIKKNPQTVVVESHLNAVFPGREAGTGGGAGSWNSQNTNFSPTTARLITATNIARPQIKFQIPVDNSASAFVPKLKTKPNSLKPLAILPEYDEAGNISSYLHPYEFELMKVVAPESQLKRKSPKKPQQMNETELMYVDTVPKLHSALEEMRGQKEIAIDVEHHSYRTFQGITCLVQVSTRVKDYLFDALALREEMHLLNEIFTDTKVVKILHGADLDIEWLQRDLSLYIVNMFDTHQAAKTLNLARLSLAYLLKHYCDIEANKTFQLADWRMRPLPNELITYARQDTHFLIYIYERLTNDILDTSHNQTNVLANIFQRSTEICKKRYAKPTIGPESHLDVFRKSKRVFDNRQIFALREIFAWRDKIARIEDESYGYVLPNHMMLQISESLPREMQGILACCNPIPPLVRQNLHALHQIVLRAREQPLVKPILETEVVDRIAISNTLDFNSKLYCPHDLSHCEEFRDDLPTLLNFKDNDTNTNIEERSQREKEEDVVSTILCKPACSVFDTPVQSEDEDVRRNLKKLEQIQFISPYERYLAILPVVEREKREEAARIEVENRKRQLCPDAPTVMIKQEPLEEGVMPIDDPDELYSLPVKEMLKRKYEESVAKKNNADKSKNNSEIQKTKRLRTETPKDDKLNFVEKVHNKQTKNQFTELSDTQNQNSAFNSTHSGDDDDDNDEAPVEMPSTSASRHLPPQHHQHKGAAKGKQRFKNKNKKNNKFKAHKNSLANQSSDKPVQLTNFDYKKVDFKKFQGGAQRATTSEIKPKFHGKANTNKANNKKFNKLFTFSNVKGKK